MSSFGGFSSNRQQMGTVSEINMIPLIDVMLVLLIIFMITAPLLTHAIKIDVPRVSSQPAEQDPESIDLAIKASGEMYWNNEPLDMDQLSEKMTQLVKEQEEKTINLRIRADGEVFYEHIAQVMATARNTGVKRLGFITTPDVSKADQRAIEATKASTPKASSAEAASSGTNATPTSEHRTAPSTAAPASGAAQSNAGTADAVPAN